MMSTQQQTVDKFPKVIIKGKPLSIRGATKVGIVVSAKAKDTVIVQKDYFIYSNKYKRKERRKSRIPAHNPPEIKATVGDIVLIGETRRISKTKSWIVLKVLTKGKLKERGEDTGVNQ